jgi:hypothetical protein
MSISRVLKIRLVALGEGAQHVFLLCRQGKVMGVTSRGIFLRLEPERIVFLSYEAQRGPLTANLVGRCFPLGVEHGEEVVIADESLTFLHCAISIDLQCEQVYASQPPLHHLCKPLPERQEYIKSLVELVTQAKQDGLALILRSNLFGESGLSEGASDAGAQKEGVERVGQALANKDPVQLANALAPFLGWGRGLTPSGDDFTAGLLLALNRWGWICGWQESDLCELNRLVTTAALQRTTLLAARLIECAGMGQADERLVQACDALFTCEISEEEIAKNLLGYGASSGVDALLGIALISLNS